MPHFEPTVPFGEPELVRASGFQRYLDELARSAPQGAVSTRLSSLSPSLTQDLMRFEQRGRPADVLEVVAACVRHSRSVTVHLHCGEKALPLTLFPRERQLHCPIDLALYLVQRQRAPLAVLQVEPAVLCPSGGPDAELIGDVQLYWALPPLLWSLAMHGERAELLTEVTGAAVYRVSPGFDLALLPADGPLRTAVMRLRREVASQREIASWAGMNRDRASRLVNALYLQAGLMVSRSHPAALGDSWFSSTR